MSNADGNYITMASHAAFTADDRKVVSAVDSEVIEYIIQQCVEILSRHIVYALVSTPRAHTKALEAQENRFPFGVGNITIVCPLRASYICTAIQTRTQDRINAIYGHRVSVENIQIKHDRTDAFIGGTDNRIWYPLLNVQISPVLLKSIGGQNTYAMASWSTGDTLVKTVKPCTPNDVAELLIAKGNYSADVVNVNEPFSGENLVYGLDAPDTSTSVYPISVPIFLGNAESDTLSLGTPYREDRTALLTASDVKEDEHPFAKLITTLDNNIATAIERLKTNRERTRTLFASRIEQLSVSTTEEHISHETCKEMASILEILVWRTMYGELNPIDPPMSMAEKTGTWLHGIQKGYDEIYITTNDNPEQLANRKHHLKTSAPLFHIPFLMSIAQYCKVEFEAHVARETQLVPDVANYWNSNLHFADKKDQRERIRMIINKKAHFVDCSATEWKTITELPQPVFKTIPLHLTVQRALYDSDIILFESNGTNTKNANDNLEQAVQNIVYSPSMLFSLRACMNPKPSDLVYTNIRPFPYMERVLLAAIYHVCDNNTSLASPNGLGSHFDDIQSRTDDPNIRDANDIDLASISRYNYYVLPTAVPRFTNEAGDGPIDEHSYGLSSNLDRWYNNQKPVAQLYDLYTIENAMVCRMKELDENNMLDPAYFVPNLIRRSDASDGIWSKTLRKLNKCDVPFADLVESPIVTIPGFTMSDDPITMMQQHCIYTHRQNTTHRNALNTSRKIIESTLLQMKRNLFTILDTEHTVSLARLPHNFRTTVQTNATNDLRKIARAIQKIGGIPAIEPETLPEYWSPREILMSTARMTKTDCVNMLDEGSDGIWSKSVSEFLMNTPIGNQTILAAADFMIQLKNTGSSALVSGYAFAVYTRTQLETYISHIEEGAPLSTFDDTVQTKWLQEKIKNCKTHGDVLDAEHLVRDYLCKCMCVTSGDHLVELSTQNNAGKREVYGINEHFAILYSKEQPLNLENFSALIKNAKAYAKTWFDTWQAIDAPDRQLAVVHFNMYSYRIFENLVHYTRGEEKNGIVPEVTRETIIECLSDNDDKYTWMRRCLSRLCHPVELKDDTAPIHLKTYGLQCVGYTPYRTPFIMTDCHIDNSSRFNPTEIEAALLARLTRKAIRLRQTCMIKTEIDVLKQFLHLNNPEDNILINWTDSSVASLHIKNNKCMLTLGTLSGKKKASTHFAIGNHAISGTPTGEINMSNTTCIPFNETMQVKGTPKPHTTGTVAYRFSNESEITPTVIENARRHNVLLFLPSVEPLEVLVEVSVDDIRKYNAEIEECLLLNTYKMMQDPVIDWHFEPIPLVDDYELAEDKKVATTIKATNVGIIAGHNGYVITSGVHYWELETQNNITEPGFYFGVCRAEIDPCTNFIDREETWLMFTHGSTWEYKGTRSNQGTGMQARPLPNISTVGKKIGLLLNMEDGTLAMFLDKTFCGFVATDLNGPLLPCILLPGIGSKVKIHGNMVPPPPQSYSDVTFPDLTVNQHKTLTEYVTAPKHFPLDNNAFCAEYGYQLALFSDTIPEQLPIKLAKCSDCGLNLRQLDDNTSRQCKLSSCKVSDACIWCTFPVERKNAVYSQCIKQLPRFWTTHFKEDVTAESPFHAECLAKLYSTGVHLFGDKQLVDPRGQTDAYCSIHNETVTFADTLDFNRVDTFLNDTKQLTYIEVHIQMAHLGLLLRQGLNKSPVPLSKCTVCQNNLHTVTEAERGMHTLCQYKYHTIGMTTSCDWCKNPEFPAEDQVHTTCHYISTKYARL